MTAPAVVEGTYLHAFLDALAPDPRMSVSEWADARRRLTSASSSEPGRWRTSRTPYLREIMDALSDAHPCREVVFQKGVQIGGTECGNNWVGHSIDCSPGPMMVVQPGLEMAKRFSRQRIDPMVEECPTLRAKVAPPKSRDASNTALFKEFQGGVLTITGANSAAGLRSLPARRLFLDELEAYKGDTEGEGDPVHLAQARTSTFARSKVFKVSTPGIAGRSRIEAAYVRSDRSRYWVPCPFCDTFQVLAWAQVRWTRGEPEGACYVCDACEREIREHHKPAMLERGEWRAEAPELSSTVRGFQLSALYSPLGWYSWSQAAAHWEEWEETKNPEVLRPFVNHVLGETWRMKGDTPAWETLYRQREAYPTGVLPEGALLVTAGVDVQGGENARLEVELVAWGRGKESWSIDYRVFQGDPSLRETWEPLEELIRQPLPHASGGLVPITKVAVDAGFATTQVHAWVRRQNRQQVIAVHGLRSDQAPYIIGHPTQVDVVQRDGRTRKRRRKGALLSWPVGVGKVKEELYLWLNLQPPLEKGEAYPPGYCHFPEEYGQEFFEQLTAEQLVPRVVRGYRRWVWEKTRPRNEALDCRVYARAAASAAGIDRMRTEHWDALELAVTGSSETTPAGRRDRARQRRPRGEGYWSG